MLPDFLVPGVMKKVQDPISFWKKDSVHTKSPEDLQISEAVQEKLKEISDKGKKKFQV